MIKKLEKELEHWRKEAELHEKAYMETNKRNFRDGWKFNAGRVAAYEAIIEEIKTNDSLHVEES